jgi:UDP-N-acetylglucosamine 2-epimerase (non-hydrolysing)
MLMSPGQLSSLIRVLRQLAETLPVVFPIHPRTNRTIETAGISTEGLFLTPPLGYLDFLQLMSHARVVLTDSGGIQEETTILQVPCLTIRENTERPITIEEGTNRLVGSDPEQILQAALKALRNPLRAGHTPELWDGHASSRILDILEQQI